MASEEESSEMMMETAKNGTSLKSSPTLPGQMRTPLRRSERLLARMRMEQPT
jgi:hypothetical protein